MPISAQLMFVPGDRLARRLDGRGRHSAGSQQNFYGSLSRRLALRRCRDKNFIFNLTTVNCQLPPLSNLNHSFYSVSFTHFIAHIDLLSAN